MSDFVRHRWRGRRMKESVKSGSGIRFLWDFDQTLNGLWPNFYQIFARFPTRYKAATKQTGYFDATAFCSAYEGCDPSSAAGLLPWELAFKGCGKSLCNNCPSYTSCRNDWQISVWLKRQITVCYCDCLNCNSVTIRIIRLSRVWFIVCFSVLLAKLLY